MRLSSIVPLPGQLSFPFIDGEGKGRERTSGPLAEKQRRHKQREPTDGAAREGGQESTGDNDSWIDDLLRDP